MGITVKQLLELCREAIEHGNGDKEILISSDDEANSYHTLFYGFEEDVEAIEETSKCSFFHDNNDPNDVVLLG